jgi:Limiting CO2-inducible proteins B/C beta carbonyic anhydrases
MGGLAGFPFGGVTAFRSMASHIPDGGSCLVVFGPHVGVDSTGAVGSVERRGRSKAGPCCESAIAAFEYVSSVSRSEAVKAEPPKVPTDAQQTFVGNMLLPYAGRLEAASDKMVELPYALYDAQKKMMMDIIKAGCGTVAGKGKIAVLGGIQINTPEGTSDFYKPMSFELYDNSGKRLEDLSDSL